MVERLIGCNKLFFVLYKNVLCGIYRNSPSSSVNKSNMRNLSPSNPDLLTSFTSFRMHRLRNSFVCTSKKCNFENNLRTPVSKFEIDWFSYWLNLYLDLLPRSSVVCVNAASCQFLNSLTDSQKYQISL